jgi:S1-C subfamily serine protease
MCTCLTTTLTGCALTVLVAAGNAPPDPAASNPGDADRARAIVEYAEQKRIELFERLAPTVVCIYDAMERGGGSGVLIDPAGFGLTNYHVVAGMLATRRGLGGLSDGKLYDLEVLGIDPTGDVAMFRLLRPSEHDDPPDSDTAQEQGRTEEKPFPFATLGDSDAVRIGDEAIAAGNPFTLSEDYTPSFTVGLVTGVHRYQYGVGSNLVYSDCIQTDAAINPGNSGGPLFNADGEIIGINGRISVNTRGRFNVGHGYAISSNQIKRFIPGLRAGLIGKHGTLEATVQQQAGRGVVFNDVRPDGAADRAGVRVGDRLVAFDDVAINSPNHFASLLGTYPSRWTVLLSLERDGQRLEITARLDPIEPKLNQPFSVQRDANKREVWRVLTRYRNEVLRHTFSDGPSGIRWSGTRSITTGGQDNPAKSYAIQAVWTRGESVHLVERDVKSGEADQDRAENKRIVRYNDATVEYRFGEKGEPYEPPPDQRAVLHALYLAQIKLLQPVDAIDIELFSHTGADAAPLPRREEVDPWKRGMIELVETSLATDMVAEYGFDVVTGRLLRILLRDPVFGRETTVLFRDYEQFGGAVLPTRIEILAPGERTVDRIDHWDIER